MKKFFWKKRSTSQILTIPQMIGGVCAKKLEVAHLFVDFSQTFDSIHRGKMEQILVAYSLPKKSVSTIMMLNKNRKVKVSSPDGDADDFGIVIGVLPGTHLPIYLLIICQDHVLRTSIYLMKENSFTQKKVIPGANYYGCTLCRWHSVSCNYTNPSRIHAA